MAAEFGPGKLYFESAMAPSSLCYEYVRHKRRSIVLSALNPLYVLNCDSRCLHNTVYRCPHSQHILHHLSEAPLHAYFEALLHPLLEAPLIRLIANLAHKVRHGNFSSLPRGVRSVFELLPNLLHFLWCEPRCLYYTLYRCPHSQHILRHPSESLLHALLHALLNAFLQ